jgi:zinc protease
LLPLHITNKEYYAFVFGLNVLGKWGGFAGRLMSTVREKEGLTYGIYARTETAGLTEFGFWRIMTFFAPDKALVGINSTLREIRTIRNNGITKTEYSRFKTILKTGHALLNDSIIRTASNIHSNQIKGLRFKDIEEHRKNMFNVTISDVNEALKKYLDPERMVIAGAGPVRSKLKELKALERLVKAQK